MTDRDWNLLLRGLRKRQCVILLGDEAGGVQERTLREGLTARLRAELKTPVPPEFELPQIAWVYQSEADKSRGDLMSAVDTFYAGWQDNPLPVHQRLAEIPFHCLITTCLDGSMEGALRRATPKRVPRVAAYDFNGIPSQIAENWSAANPLLYHLFGRIGQNGSLVLTEQDLVDCMVSIAAATPPLPERLRVELRDPETMFLFLGFGVRNWYPRILLDVLKAQPGSSRSFALEEFPAPADLGRGVFFYRQGYKIEVFDRSVTRFIDELYQRTADLRVAASAAPTTTAASDEPGLTVFICHDHDDAPLAARVASLLRENGFTPWLDRISLDPGQDWDREIRNTIAEVDYFLVLVTPSLNATGRSVALQELEIARQIRSRVRGLFMIPLMVEGATILEELRDLHQGPIPGAGGEEPLLLTAGSEREVITRLASVIRRDRQRRIKKGA